MLTTEEMTKLTTKTKINSSINNAKTAAWPDLKLMTVFLYANVKRNRVTSFQCLI